MNPLKNMIGRQTRAIEPQVIKQTHSYLHKAIECGKIEEVKTILQDGGDVNVQGCDGNTSLHIALFRNDLQSKDLVTLLLERGANARLLNKRGQSALFFAIKYNPGCVSLIINHVSGKDTVNIPDFLGCYPIHIAILRKDLHSKELVTILLEKGVNAQLRNSHEETPLIVAVKHNPECVSQILNNVSGIDSVNIPDIWDCYPLHAALLRKDHLSKELVPLLLERGANAKFLMAKKETALIIAIKHNPECVPLIINNINGEDTINIPDYFGHYPLHIALLRKDPQSKELVTLLLDRGANAKLHVDKKETALIVAIKTNSECAPMIIKSVSGKDAVNIPDIQGYYPLHNAVKHGNTNVLKLLLDYGAFIECKDSDGETPLFYFTWCIKCFEILLDRGALFNARDNNGKTPLHNASVCHSDIVDQLLIHGADVNCSDIYGRTPLHLAKSGSCVKKLIQNGAQVHIKDNWGMTPLHMAVIHDDVIEKVRLLLKMGAYVNSQENGFQTPLHLLGRRNMERERELIELIANTLLDWGASLIINDNKGRTPTDCCPEIKYYAEQHNVRRAFVKLSYPQTSNFRLCVNDELNLKSYKTSCLEEVERLKLVRIGKHSLYNIFYQYSNPTFLTNEKLEEAVNSDDYNLHFPIYCSLLQSTYRLAKERAYLLEYSADTLNIPLPREVTWYILTFVDDNSLRNVVEVSVTK